MATYSAQCSAVGNFAYANYFKLYVELTETDVDVANNRSKVKYNVYCKSSGSGSISANHFLYFNINGTDKRNETIKVNVSSPNANIPIASGTTDYIGHNSGGDKKISYSAQIKASSYGVSASLSGEFALTTIPRASSVSGGSGNIGGTTTISVSRASTSFTHTLRYAFGSLRGTIATGVGTSYTWTIPTSFYAQIPNSKTGTGTIYCDTYSGSRSIGTKSTTFTATVTESSSGPTLSVTLTDTNATTKALTGNASKMVKGKSTGQLVITSSVKNSATIKSVTINGTSAGTAASITKTYANISTASFTIVTTDSRGFSKSQVVTPSYVNYVPLTLNANFFRPQPATGEVQLKYSGNYFNGSFGSVSNTLSITWKYKKSTDSSYTTGGTITPTISNNKIVEATISLGKNYNYQTSYDFQVTAEDKLVTTTITANVSVGMPVFYWGKDFLDVNGDLRRNGTSTNLLYAQVLTPTNGTPLEATDGGGELQHTKLCSIYDNNNRWWNMINLRHQNGEGSDGTKYGMQIIRPLTDLNGAILTRAQSDHIWTDWEAILRSKTLYNNTSGTTGTVTLSESAAKFSYLDIAYTKNGQIYSTGKIPSPNQKKIHLQIGQWFDSASSVQMGYEACTVSGTSITRGTYYFMNTSTGGGVSAGNGTNDIAIFKVIGYR